MPRSNPVQTPHGRCIVLELDDGDALPFVGTEESLFTTTSPTRRRELAAGRAALRSVLGEEIEILKDDRGAPILPAGWTGSLSHKGPRAAAIVAPVEHGFVGIDIEIAAPARMPIERRILTPREQSRVSTGTKDVTRHFAIKEAIYKAVDPIVRRYVAFTEVELEIRDDGSVDVTVLDLGRLPVMVEAWWHERDGIWLATARARRR
jgi:enterobactin synthetase component D